MMLLVIGYFPPEADKSYLAIGLFPPKADRLCFVIRLFVIRSRNPHFILLPAPFLSFSTRSRIPIPDVPIRVRTYVRTFACS